MAKKKSYKRYAKEFFKNDEYEFIDMIEATGLSLHACVDVLYDYKEDVFGEFVDMRIYP